MALFSLLKTSSALATYSSHLRSYRQFFCQSPQRPRRPKFYQPGKRGFTHFITGLNYRAREGVRNFRNLSLRVYSLSARSTSRSRSSKAPLASKQPKTPRSTKNRFIYSTRHLSAEASKPSERRSFRRSLTCNHKVYTVNAPF